MREQIYELIEFARAGDFEALRTCVMAGAPLAERDESGWTALDWAAGSGDTAIVRFLMEAGADPAATGPDGRTPYEIAVAAGHTEAALLLRAATGEGADGWRPYCRGYTLADMRQSPDWRPVGGHAEPGETVVYLHDDLTVTRSIWHGEDVIWDRVDAQWERFCKEDLTFKVPDDLI